MTSSWAPDREAAIRQVLTGISTPLGHALSERPPEVVVTGDDAVIRVDATGLTVPLDVVTADDADVEPPAADGARRVQGVLREATLRALPLSVGGVDVDLDAAAGDVPILWLEHPDGSVRVAEDDERTWRGSSRARVRLRTKDVERLARAFVTAALAADDPKTRLTRLRVSLRQTAPTTVRVAVSAGIRRGLLGGSATASGTLVLDAHHVLRVEHPRIGTRNVFVAILLLFVRRRALDAIGAWSQSLDEALPAGMRLVDVQVSIDRHTELSFRVAGTTVM